MSAIVFVACFMPSAKYGRVTRVESAQVAQVVPTLYVAGSIVHRRPQTYATAPPAGRVRAESSRTKVPPLRGCVCVPTDLAPTSYAVLCNAMNWCLDTD
eukprot:2620421-Pyramimonas_sp.AAC.1